MVGLGVFVIGAVTAVLLAVNGDDGGEDAVPRRQVLVAARAIPSGTTGSNAVAQGLIERRGVELSALPDDVLGEVAELAGTVAVVTVGPGQILRAAQFPQAQTRIGTLRIPPGKRALAIQLENVPGVAGFAGAGDLIDVFGIASVTEDGTPEVQMILQGVEVLNVNGTVLAPTQGQPGGPGLVFLLAVTPEQAERMIYLGEFERLYFTLVPDGEDPVPATPGVGRGDALVVG